MFTIKSRFVYLVFAHPLPMAIGAALSTKWSLKASNVLGFFKVVTPVFISISGLVVLGWPYILALRILWLTLTLRTRGKELPPTLRLSRMLLSSIPQLRRNSIRVQRRG
ncbi:hypothetical protein V1507DRAFT_321639 [Lipomyces tetrasporus]